MAYLGDVPVEAAITITVVWNPIPGSPALTGSLLTLVHVATGTILGPFVGEADGTNAWKFSTSLPEAGRWRIRWATDPVGGFSEDTLYAQ